MLGMMSMLALCHDSAELVSRLVTRRFSSRATVTGDAQAIVNCGRLAVTG